MQHATVPEHMDGVRLDRVVASVFDDYSRTLLQQWMDQGRLTANGQSVKKRSAAKAGQLLELRPDVRYPDGELLPAKHIPLQILHEDEHLIVLNKQAGLVSHPAPGHPDSTLVNALIHLDEKLSQLPRAGLVHRLDKDTTGLMVVARCDRARNGLVSQLNDRSMSRQYLALVRGSPVAGQTLTGPMGRHPQNRLKMAVRRDGRVAETSFRIKERFGGHCELKVRLATGRTHQIRVHLSAAGLPIIGDPLYTGGSLPVRGGSDALNRAVGTFPRQALHAWTLGLVHPGTGQPMEWRCEPPEDYLNLRQKLADEMRNSVR